MSSGASCRNFVIAGHSGSGKTTLVERILSKAGAIPRMGAVESKNTISDFTPEEQDKQSSIYAGVMNCTWKDCQYFFTDTPGYGEFIGQYAACGRVADAALVVIDAVDGPQVGTARAWKLAKGRPIPRCAMVNRLDKDRSNFKDALATMRKNHGKNVIIPLFWPVGEGENFKGIVNVLTDTDIPAEIADDVAECRELWMSAIAETDEELTMRFLDDNGAEFTTEEIARGLRASVVNCATIPVFVGSAAKDIGITEMMDCINQIFPSALDTAKAPDTLAERKDDGDAVGVVFKCINDPYSGQLAFVRTITGTFKSDTDYVNISRDGKERFGQLLLMNGKNQTAVTAAGPGSIFAVAKLKNTGIGDTISSNPAVKALPEIEFPGAVMSYAVSAVKSGEDDKIAQGLNKLAEIDPTIRLRRDEETHEFLLSGMGDQHLAIVAKRLKDQFRAEVALATPKVPYRETITAPGEGHYRHKKQTGGAGQFAEVYLKIAPNEAGYEFANEVVGGTIPKNFIPAVEKGVLDVLSRGPLVGCTMERIRVAVYDGKYHPVDSNEMAFKIAGRMAFKEAISKAKPVLLEPIMHVNIQVPDMYMGDVNGDLNHRRGRVLGMEAGEGFQNVMAEVPLAEMAKYATELRSMTQGRGSFDMAFERYEQVPSNVANEIIAKHQQEEEKEQ